MLWFIRRPRIKALKRWSVARLPESRREKAWNNMEGQERFARRYGVKFLEVVLTLFFLWIAFVLIYAWVVTWATSGSLEAIRSRRPG